MTRDEVTETLRKEKLDFLVVLFEKGALVLDVNGTTSNKMQLKRSGATFSENSYEKAKFWYRGMPMNEARELVANNYESVNWNVESYVGISHSFSYSLSYLTINNPGVVVEFSTDNEAWLPQQWAKCPPKLEGKGVFSYGLGRKGTVSSKKSECKSSFKPEPLALGEIFSKWMKNTDITTRIVWVLVPR